MKTRSLLLGAVASLALSSTAVAGEMNGWYVGIEGGANWIEEVDGVVFDPTPTPGTAEFDGGWSVLATVGRGFMNNWRAEFEAGYRHNDFDTGLPIVADVEEWSAMLNVLYDIHLTKAATLSFGAGAGGDFAQMAITGFEDDDWNFAYQGIVGLSYAISDRLDLTLNYRYLRVQEPEFSFPGPVTLVLDDVTKHTATLGLRYAFGVAAPSTPMAEAAPPPPPPMEPEIARQFIIFFGFNKCNITPEADGLLSQAADTAKKVGSAAISIIGHTDTTGSPKQNQKLSECRANAAKTNLVGKGISASSITASGRGESELMVQTADGMKEPQNRRAQIDLQ
jgi:OmpA-OmpF porin, OOP family